VLVGAAEFKEFVPHAVSDTNIKSTQAYFIYSLRNVGVLAN
jgi:hypothetical protein